MLEAFAWMVIGHAVADYPLQGDWLAAAKNPTKRPVAGEVIWPGALFCHAAIHAGAVKLATGSWLLAGAELVMHGYIDWLKCKGHASYNSDQAAHIVCKMAWALCLANGA